MLTQQQEKLLSFIHGRLLENAVSPSFEEMKEALGLKSKSGIHRLVSALEERGFLRRLPNRARALEIIRLPDSFGRPNATVLNKHYEPAKEINNILRADFSKTRPHDKPETAGMREIPLHGRIAAGTPIEALEQTDNYIMIASEMAGRQDCFALEVSGDSMIEKAILDGDIVVIERCDTARDGEVVVALVDGQEATLKTIQKKGSHIALLPANRHHSTQVYEASQVQIQGRLIGLVRRYH